MTSSPELAAVLAASSWASSITVLFLIAGLVGVLVLNGRARRRFHERQEAARHEPQD